MNAVSSFSPFCFRHIRNKLADHDSSAGRSHRTKRTPRNKPGAQGSLAAAFIAPRPQATSRDSSFRGGEPPLYHCVLARIRQTRPTSTIFPQPPSTLGSHACARCAATSPQLGRRHHSVVRPAAVWRRGKVCQANATIGARQQRRKEAQSLTRAYSLGRDWGGHIHVLPSKGLHP